MKTLTTFVLKSLRFLFILFSFSSFSATIYVNSTTGNDANAGTSGSPYQTFHKAYTMAVDGDIINATGIFDWSSANEAGDVVNSGYILSKNLTIEGNSKSTTFFQAAASRGIADRSVFFVSANKTVTFNNLTIRYGNVTQEKLGGGLTLDGAYCGNYPCSTITGTAILNYVDVKQNDANGVTNSIFYLAGGIYLREASTITINYSNVLDNDCTCRLYSAGGIAGGEQSQSLTINNSTIALNTASSTYGSSFPYSYASVAGGMALQRFGRLIMTNSTIHGNSTDNYGGAIVANYHHFSRLTNVTIANNTATLGAGGVVWVTPYAGGNYTTLFIKNSILANNSGADLHAYDATSASQLNASYSIIENFTNITLTGTGMITGNQANLDLATTLADNSSTNGTQTLEILNTSVAVNAGTTTANGYTGYTTNIPTNDQRDFPRDATVDIGAFEYYVAPPPPPAPPTPNTWLGTTSTDWGDASNWSDGVVPSLWDDIEISASAVRDLVLDQGRAIHDLTFNGSGYKILIGHFDLTISGVISSADANNYIKSNGDGSLFVTIPTGHAKTLPIGKSAYNPVTISNNTGAGDDFGVRVSDEVLLNGTSGSAITTPIVNRTWHIDKGSANGGQGVDFFFRWNAAEEINGTLTNPQMNHHNGSYWHIPTVTSTTLGTHSLSVIGYTGTFSPFAIGEGTSALPVEMLSFAAECTENGNLVVWQTASENNSASFEVEKSENAQDWLAIGSFQAAGNSTTVQSYSFLDQNKADRGVHYYRLKQYDMNGAATIYGPISTNCIDQDDLGIVVAPNPNNGAFQLYFESAKAQDVALSMVTADGRMVYQETIHIEEGSSMKFIRIDQSQAGLYHLQIKHQEGTSTRLISVQ